MNTEDLTPMEAVVVEYFPSRPEEGALEPTKRAPGSCLSQVVAAFTLLVCASASLFFLASFSEEAFLATRDKSRDLDMPSSRHEYSYPNYPSQSYAEISKEEREKSLEASFLKFAEFKASMGPLTAAVRQRNPTNSPPLATMMQSTANPISNSYEKEKDEFDAENSTYSLSAEGFDEAYPIAPLPGNFLDTEYVAGASAEFTGNVLSSEYDTPETDEDYDGPTDEGEQLLDTAEQDPMAETRPDDSDSDDFVPPGEIMEYAPNPSRILAVAPDRFPIALNSTWTKNPGLETMLVVDSKAAASSSDSTSTPFGPGVDGSTSFRKADNASDLQLLARLKTGDDASIDGKGEVGIEGGVIRSSQNESVPTETFHSPAIGQWSTLIEDNADQDSVLRLIGQTMKSYMNDSVDPCKDFYEYACGKWDDMHPIPNDQASINTFTLLRTEVEQAVKQLLEEPDDVFATLYNGTAAFKAKLYYNSCMDMETIEQRGASPLINLLEGLGGWPMIQDNWTAVGFDWVQTVTNLRLMHNSILITSWLSIDPGNSSQYALQLDQGSLFLGSKDYYVRRRFEPLREKYLELIIDVAVLLGANRSDAENDARDIIEFETQVAMAKTSREDRQSFFDLYKKLTLEELMNLTGEAIDWLSYLNEITFGKFQDTDSVVVYERRYFVKLAEIVDRTDPRTVANYIFWMFAANRIKNLGKDFEEVENRFNRFATGRNSSPPRWQFCVRYAKMNWAHAVGALFIKRFYDEESLMRTNSIIDDLMNEFLTLLRDSEWMDKTTRKRAIVKAVGMRRNIGYPDFIDDPVTVDEIYANITMSSEDFMENHLTMIRHHSKLEMLLWDAPVNRSQWATPPTKVNAFYHLEKNQIMFPAGILQPPFFHKNFPKSLNFGGIGVVIGHEITHGFDDKGRNFDETGVLNQWWEKLTEQKFLRRAKCVSDMYSTFHLPEINLHLNGITTRGENIADLGGMKVASKAYDRWLEKSNQADVPIPGMNFTNEQMFYINYAQIWCTNPRPQSLISQIKQGQHTPGKYRVLGTLASTPAFGKAFNCPEGAPMNPKNRCEVW